MSDAVSDAIGPSTKRAGEFWLRVAAVAFGFAVLLYGAITFWNYFGGPGVPELEMGWTSVSDDTPAGVPCGRALLVRRLITSDRTAHGVLHAWLERRTELEVEPGVIVEPLRVAVSRADIVIHEGAHLRQRHWDIPCTVRPGSYVYRSEITFCWREQCETVPLPPAPVVLR